MAAQISGCVNGGFAVARIRTIKPEFWIDERVGECSPTARLLFIATWNFADDNGNLERSAKQIKAQALPYDSVDCEPLLLELLERGLLEEYAVNGNKYLHVSNFDKHQKIEKKSAARHPLPNSSPTTPLPVGVGREGKGREVITADDFDPSGLVEEIHQAHPKPERSQKCLVAIMDAAAEVSVRLNLEKAAALRHLRDRAATYKRLKSGFWVGETRFFAEQIYRQSDEVWKSESTAKPARTSDVPLGRAKWEGLN
jgi:hypothetical protein